MKIAIVTDSTSDLPLHLASAHQIEVIPNLLMIENQTYIDGEGITREEFYSRLATFSIPPSTAAPSISVYQQVYDRILNSGYAQILSLHPSAALSALFSIASVAAQSFKDKVFVVDSHQVSLGLGFQAVAAAEAAERGASVPEIIHYLEQIKERVRVVALLDTLEYVRRSGRVNWVTASLGNVLGLKALIEVKNGIVHRLGLSRNRRQAIEQLVKYLAKIGQLERFAILHTTPPDENEVQALVRGAGKVPCEPFLHPVTTVIGTHVGPNVIGFAAVNA